jgi:serine protease AprX
MPAGPPPDHPAASGRRPGRQRRPLLRRTVVADALLDPGERERMGFSPHDDVPIPVVVELNLRHRAGLSGARERFLALYQRIPGDPPPLDPEPVADTYYPCRLTIDQIRALVAADMEGDDPPGSAIYRIWPDFPVSPLIDRSTATVKADAARRSYGASGRGITWAVVDSGIDDRHLHFRTHSTLGGDVADLHRDFTLPGPARPGGALRGNFGHGTHVAGIIAGGLPAKLARGRRLEVLEHVVDPSEPDLSRLARRQVDPADLTGMAPECKLVSLKALGDNGGGSSMNVVRALEYVRKELNGSGRMLRVHGVNLSVGYEFDPKWFACGQSPICAEVDRLVRSGVVVVVAAGNTGYGSLPSMQRQTDVGLAMTINDPGNAELAITVGATHRDMPHTYGVSYFSSKGPTGDGRAKPDLVAPGERITSCAAGRALAGAYPDGPAPDPERLAVYVEDNGTSMAAPHVSGVIAAFLSIRREFIGQPERVKQVFLESATSLGRERYFQGHGLVDLMRAIQSI